MSPLHVSELRTAVQEGLMIVVIDWCMEKGEKGGFKLLTQFKLFFSNLLVKYDPPLERHLSTSVLLVIQKNSSLSHDESALDNR